MGEGRIVWIWVFFTFRLKLQNSNSSGGQNVSFCLFVSGWLKKTSKKPNDEFQSYIEEVNYYKALCLVKASKISN